MSRTTELSEKYVKLAKREVGEDPAQTATHIISFRRWLQSMPHIKCCDDDDFLLMFLRQSKFNHLKAQKRLDNFCTMSVGNLLNGKVWTTPLDICSPELDKYLNMGIHLPLGFTEAGQSVLLFRVGGWKPDKMEFSEVFYHAYKVMLMIIADPRTIIGGLVCIFDLTNMTSKHSKLMSDPKVIRHIIRFMQESVPARISKFIYYNEGSLFDAIFSIFSFYMNEKFRNRVMRVGSKMDTACDAVPGLKVILPVELGGQGKTVKEIIEENKKNVINFYLKDDFTGGIEVEESKRPKETSAYLKEYKEYTSKAFQTKGIFIRLADDEI